MNKLCLNMYHFLLRFKIISIFFLKMLFFFNLLINSNYKNFHFRKILDTKISIGLQKYSNIVDKSDTNISVLYTCVYYL